MNNEAPQLGTQACCAHRNVEYVRIEHPGGTCSDSWRCSMCKTPFWPSVPAVASESEPATCPTCGGGKCEARAIGGGLYGKQVAPVYCTDSFHGHDAKSERIAKICQECKLPQTGKKDGSEHEEGCQVGCSEQDERIAEEVAPRNEEFPASVRDAAREIMNQFYLSGEWPVTEHHIRLCRIIVRAGATLSSETPHCDQCGEPTAGSVRYVLPQGKEKL
jgi:hypothetical protein